MHGRIGIDQLKQGNKKAKAIRKNLEFMTERSKLILTATGMGLAGYFLLWPLPLCILVICVLLIILIRE